MKHFIIVFLSLILLEEAGWAKRNPLQEFKRKPDAISDQIFLVSSVEDDSKTRLNMTWHIVGHQEKPLCYYQDIVNPDPGFLLTVLKSKSGKRYVAASGGLIPPQDLTIRTLKRGEAVSVSVKESLVLLRKSKQIALFVQFAGCNGEEGPSVQSRWFSVPTGNSVSVTTPHESGHVGSFMAK